MPHHRRSAILSLLLVAIGLHGAEAPRQFIFGTDFDPALPPAARDLLQEVGIDCVRLTGGGYSWAAGTHRDLAADLAKRGIGVYLQLGSHYPSADYFPRRDAWLVDQDGKTGVEDRTSWAIQYPPNGGGWPQYSYANLSIREQFTRDFTAYVKQVAPAGRPLGVIVHNEPGYFWSTDRVFDYGPEMVSGFRTWLGQRHGDIATLNQRWGTTFADFAAVTPPGHPPVAHLGAWLDWRRFQVETIAGFLAWESRLAGRILPGVPRTTNLDGPLNHWFAYRLADIQSYSAAMDTVGIDIYPTKWSDRALIPYAMDQLQGTAQGRPAQVIETDVFCAKQWPGLDEEARAGLLRAELWTMVGHGADGILLWGFRRDEFSLTVGEFNPRVLASRDVAHHWRMLDLSQYRRARPAVAIAVDTDAYLLHAGREAKPHAETVTLDAEVHGLHAALTDAGFAVDVIDVRQLRAGTAGAYRAILLPLSSQMDQELADALKRFTTAGGLLLAEPPFADTDRWGNPVAGAPGYGLTGLVGTAGGRMEVFAEAAGAAYLHGGRRDGLPDRLRTLLAGAGLKPTLDCAPETAVGIDVSQLTDGRGNHLLVLAGQGDHGKPPTTVGTVDLHVPLADPTTIRAAFTLRPTQIVGDRVQAGVEPLPFQVDGDAIHLTLTGNGTTLPVLLAHDAGPLLDIDAPTNVSGAQIAITVRCYNPGAVAVQGTLMAHLRGATAGSTPIAVPAYGNSTVTMDIPTGGSAAERLTIRVELTPDGGGRAVTALPVDIAVR